MHGLPIFNVGNPIRYLLHERRKDALALFKEEVQIAKHLGMTDGLSKEQEQVFLREMATRPIKRSLQATERIQRKPGRPAQARALGSAADDNEAPLSSGMLESGSPSPIG
jgi:hypothetical protein